MEKEARIKELQEMVPYLAAEYNMKALGEVHHELKALDADYSKARWAGAGAGAARLGVIMSDRDELQPQVKNLNEQIQAAGQQIRAGNATNKLELWKKEVQKLTDYILQYRKEHPTSKRALFFYYGMCLPEEKNLDTILSPEEKKEILAKENGDEIIIRLGAEKLSIPAKDYDTAFDVYIALEDYPAARALRYRQGEEAMKEEKFDEAAEFFRAALDHPGAKEKAAQAARAVETRKAFLAQVGDTKTYLERRIKETHRAALAELRVQLNKAYIDTPDIGVGSLIFCFVGFLLTLAMHTDPDMDNNVIFIFFPLAMSIALHMMFDMDFGWIKSCAITFGILILPKILHDFSVDCFDTPTPAYVLLNLLCAAPLVVALVSALRKIPANRAYHRATVLRAELKPVENKLRAELIDEYAPLVGRELADKWVKELRSGI